MPPSFWIVFCIFIVIGIRRSWAKWGTPISTQGLEVWLVDNRLSILALLLFAAAVVVFLPRRKVAMPEDLEDDDIASPEPPPEPEDMSPIERVLALEETRRQLGYKPGWLFYRCEEYGLLDEYVYLLRQGVLPAQSFSEATRGRFSEDSQPKREVSPAKLDPFEILKVPRGSAWSQIQRSYRDLIRQHHPDKFQWAGPEIQRLAKEMTIQFNDAYHAIESAYRSQGRLLEY